MEKAKSKNEPNDRNTPSGEMGNSEMEECSACEVNDEIRNIRQDRGDRLNLTMRFRYNREICRLKA